MDASVHYLQAFSLVETLEIMNNQRASKLVQCPADASMMSRESRAPAWTPGGHKPRASTSDAVTGAIDVFRRARATAAPLR